MKSPARRHRERMTAQVAGTSPAADRRADDQYQTMLAGLWSMRRDLKDIKSRERKIAYKRDTALPQLMDYVDGVINADTGAEDTVVTTAMIWLFDVGDLAGGLRVADYVIRHNLPAPDQYKRDSLTIVAEEVADRALERLKEEPAPDPDALESLSSNIEASLQLVGDQDIHDQVLAKLYKASGTIGRERGSLKQAVTDLERALSLHEGIGVKKDIERLHSQIKKQDTEQHNSQQNSQNSTGAGQQ